MSARKDLEKILHYAKERGIKVHFRAYKPANPDSAWYLFNTNTIVIFKRKGDSYKKTALSLLHELCHNFTYRMDKTSFDKYIEVISTYKERKPKNEIKLALWEAERHRQRVVIYEREKTDLQRMTKYHAFLELENISLAEIKVDRDFDIWQFAFNVKHKRYPKAKERNAKKKQLKKKYKII